MANNLLSDRKLAACSELSEKRPIQSLPQFTPDIVFLREFVVALDECNEELLLGRTSSQSGNITFTATENITPAVALSSLLSQANKAKQSQ